MELICELNDRIILGTEGLSAKAPRVTARAIPVCTIHELPQFERGTSN